jgi:hypothetical protein
MVAPAAGIEEALGKFQELVDQVKQKDNQIDQLTRLTDELRSSLEEEQKKNAKFMEYEDIILDPEAEKEWKQITIRSGKTHKELVLRVQQLHHNTRPISISSVVENIINFGVSRAGWRQVLKNRYGNKPEAQRLLGNVGEENA